MGKNKKKKDPEKRALQRAAKEAKQDKKAARRLAKESSRLSSCGDGEAAAAGGRKGGGGCGGGRSNKEKDEDNIDAILAGYAERNRELTTPVVEVLSGERDEPPFPYPPRGNFTLTAVPGGGGGSGGELVMFGGEYYDGVQNVVFDELLRWDPDARRADDDDDDNDDAETGGPKEDGDESSSKPPNPGVWRRILSPPPNPPARCSHTTVYYNNALYVFGGELATSERYHHYKDMWKFDLKTNLWTELKPRGGLAPPSRSGHRALVWRHYMVLFGGFYEALRETRWYGDLWLYDFATNAWTEMTYSKLATTPPARSAFNFSLCPKSDTAFLYGGYSKLKNPAPGSRSEARVHNDCWALHLRGVTAGRTPTWDRVSRKGEYPSARSGTGCATHRSRMLVFGGVSDTEGDHHSMRSVFYDDLFAFDMERRRWFRMGLRAAAAKVAGGGGRRRRRRGANGGGKENDAEGGKDGFSAAEGGADDGEGDTSSSDDDEEIESGKEGEAASSGWDLDRLRANMFAFIDGNGNIVYEKIEPDEGESRRGDDTCNDDEANMEGEGEGEGVDAADEEQQENGKAEAEEPALTEEKDKEDELQEEEEEEGDKRETTTKAVEKEAKTSGRRPVARTASATATTSASASVLVPPGAVAASEVMTVNASSGVPEAVSRDVPLPRINAAAVVRGSTLYIYGGLLEVGEREVTLDDCWSIDLHGRERWACLWPGSMHRQVWRGVTEDDDESYVSTGKEDSCSNDDNDDDDYDGWGVNGAIDEEGGGGGDGAAEPQDDEEAHRKAARKAAKKEKKRGLRDEIAKLKEQLDLTDADRTPQMGEAMADFYTRTAQYWEGRAAAAAGIESGGGSSSGGGDGEPKSVKEMKREGFNIARERYEELKPILDRLNELEAQQREAEGSKKSRDRKEKSSKKKERRK